jgi:glycine cleavage system aminomethyltransferase T
MASYLGQETVVRVLARGHVNWHVRGLRLVPGAPVPTPGDAVLDAAGKEVGRVRSAVSSPTVGAPIALARIRREVADAGTALKVRAADGSDHAAQVVVGPFAAG